MSRLRIPFADEPQETRFFLIIAGWAAVLGTIYWVVSGEAAGTALLVGLALSTGAMAAWLIRGRPRLGRDGDGPSGTPPDPDEPDTSGGGTAGVDRPFHDEEGRIPDATLGPFGVGLGIALIVTGAVFGLAPVAVGVVALLWGAWSWLADARAELDALDGSEAVVPGVSAGQAARRRVRGASRPVSGTDD